MTNGSYRQILRATSITGGAAAINIIFSLLRVKIVALLLGPAGVGLIGLLGNLMGTGASVAALGTSSVGTRQIAEAVATEDAFNLATVRRALFWGSLGLAIVGSFSFWLLRFVLATHVLNNPSMSTEAGWLAVGVGLTVASGSQGALLNGMRRISDMARVSMWSAGLASGLGVLSLFFWHDKGLIFFVLATPLCGFLVGHWYVDKLPKMHAPPTPMRFITQQWAMMTRLGISLMLAGLVLMVGQLLIRSLVLGKLGAGALGHFETSWVISMTYMGFVLQAMSADYYPRLTGVIKDHFAVNKLINEQTEVALLLSAPVFLVLLAVAPRLIVLLYSGKFTMAATVLRWQILGDILKLTSWPLAIVILAAGDGRVFFLVESIAIGVFALCVWVGLSNFGLTATGVGFLVMYAIYLPIVYFLARRRTGFRWSDRVTTQLSFLVVAYGLVFCLTKWSELVAAISGMGLAMIFGLYGVARLGNMANLSGPVKKIVELLSSLLTMFGVRV